MATTHRHGMAGQAGEEPEAVRKEFERGHAEMCSRMDKSFAGLMVLQWAAGLAVWVSPPAWRGGSMPAHALEAIFYGGLLTMGPMAMMRRAPGERATRLTVAAAQMLMSGLLIDLTGGRIETHFHIFGSLALLGFYLDWQVLAVASAAITADQLLRGLLLPYPVFGVAYAQPWLWLEQTGWVLFFAGFLIAAGVEVRRDMRARAAERLRLERLLHRGWHDELTGLPNRSLLDETMRELAAEARVSGRRFSCLYVDLDRFKEINDQFGHHYGDALLKQVVERIGERLGGEIFLARRSSDEFVALIPEADARGEIAPRRAEELARAVLRSMRQTFTVEGQELILGASIGISLYPEQVEDEEQALAELLQRSDRAMLQVKRSGRNDYLIYTPELFAETVHRDEAERRLRLAIVNREFQVHYQPIFRANGEVLNLEALLRWVTPPRPGKETRGSIPPSQFIPLAEQSGLIVQLGQFVLHEACRQATEWRSRGLLPGRIAVNVSSLELSREDYAETTILTLEQHYTPADAIELEVTESALVQDFELAERHLRDLRSYGIQVSIDDFGTGYSSLSRLRQLTLDTLKVDRLFIEGVVSSDADRTVVEHIIAMAHTLQMKVVAEGVETEAQLKILRELGCDLIQGFLLARPNGWEQTESLLIDHQRSPVVGALV